MFLFIGDVQSEKCHLQSRVFENLYAKLIVDLKEMFEKKIQCISDTKVALLAADRHNVTYFSFSEFQSIKKTNDLFDCFANDCKYFNYTILKRFVYAIKIKKAKELMDTYIKEVDKTLITGLNLEVDKNAKNKYEKNTKIFTVICSKKELFIEELNFIVETLEDCLELLPCSILVENVTQNFILVCKISANAQLPHKISTSKLKRLSEKRVELLVDDDDKMELKIPLDCSTEVISREDNQVHSNHK